MKLTKAQRKVLSAKHVCWSASSGRTWAVPETTGDSFPVRDGTMENLRDLGLMQFTRQRGAVRFYEPTDAGRAALSLEQGEKP